MLYKQVSNDWWRGAVDEKEGLIPDKYITIKMRYKLIIITFGLFPSFSRLHQRRGRSGSRSSGSRRRFPPRALIVLFFGSIGSRSSPERIKRARKCTFEHSRVVAAGRAASSVEWQGAGFAAKWDACHSNQWGGGSKRKHANDEPRAELEVVAVLFEGPSSSVE